MARLLVVEDHADIAEGLQAAFELEGHTVDVARDGRLALVAARAAPPDLVLLDLGLPHVDGFGVLARLRESGVWCPVLILSARGAQADKVEGFRLGADDYVTKPFGMLELYARVAALLRRAEVARQAVAHAAERAVEQAAARAAPASGADCSDAALAARFGLTPRQAQVARLVVEGLTNAQVAGRLGVSVLTARNHVDEVMRKLDVPTRGRVGAVLRG